MKCRELLNIPTHDLQGKPQAAAFVGNDRLVYLNEMGHLRRYRPSDGNDELLVETVPENTGFADGGFDPLAESVIDTLDGVVAVRNVYKGHCIIFIENCTPIRLIRPDDAGGSYLKNTRYPFALFRNGEGVPHAIFASKWNRLEVVNLFTRQKLTALKSNIEEGAEKRIPPQGIWPCEMDYFYGELVLSPDRTKFFSRGWIWQPMDCGLAFDMQDYLENIRVRSHALYAGEFLTRGACFVDNDTVAICGDEDRWSESLRQIILMDFREEDREIGRITPDIPFDLKGVELAWNAEKTCFYLWGKEIGLAALDEDGRLIFHSAEEKVGKYDSERDCFLSWNENCVRAFSLIE